MPKAIVMSEEMAKIMKSIEDKADDDEYLLSCGHALEKIEVEEKYFFNSLCYDMEFENCKEFGYFKRCLPTLALMYKRVLAIIFTLKKLLQLSSIQDKYTLDEHALAKVVKCYTDDLLIFKARYNCPQVQLPKIAGLMTNLLVKYRPIVPLNIKDNPRPTINEVFAIYHALCICSDFSSGDELAKFNRTKEHKEFYADMRYLLNRNYTPESLIMIFKTLCMYQFQSFWANETDG